MSLRKFLYNHPNILFAAGFLQPVLAVVFICYEGMEHSMLSPIIAVVFTLFPLASYFTKGDTVWGLTRKINNALVREGDQIDFLTRDADGKMMEHSGKVIYVCDARNVDDRSDMTKSELSSAIFCMLDGRKIIRVQDEQTGLYHTVPIFFVSKIGG